jgi:hypothetical protein
MKPGSPEESGCNYRENAPAKQVKNDDAPNDFAIIFLSSVLREPKFSQVSEDQQRRCSGLLIRRGWNTLRESFEEAVLQLTVLTGSVFRGSGKLGVLASRLSNRGNPCIIWPVCCMKAG